MKKKHKPFQVDHWCTHSSRLNDELYEQLEPTISYTIYNTVRDTLYVDLLDGLHFMLINAARDMV